MSKSSDALENSIVEIFRQSEFIPELIPLWMIELGIKPHSKIIDVKGIGSYNPENKTDVLVILNNSEPIKISAKLSNADYFGNWYGHKRFLHEFGLDAFKKQTKAATDWANWWIKQPQAKLFVGVSLCYGRRTGNTAQNFLDVYAPEDVMSICRGYGTGDQIANCLYCSSEHPNSVEEVINLLQPITKNNIKKLVGEFKIAYRPINPITEGTNRGKNVYTKFVPYDMLKSKTEISNINELSKYGKFQIVEPNSINHNHILNELNDIYNIFIPRK